MIERKCPVCGEAMIGAYDGICVGWCRKHDKAMDSDEPACEHFEEFKEE